MRNVVCFLLLGFFCGFLYDVDTLLVKSIRIKFFRFMFDFLAMCVFGVLFFTFLLALNDGIFRGYYFSLFSFGILFYLATIFKLFSKPRAFMIRMLKKLHIKKPKAISKLNYFKKVLQKSK